MTGFNEWDIGRERKLSAFALPPKRQSRSAKTDSSAHYYNTVIGTCKAPMQPNFANDGNFRAS
jgi:hypothetical protein